MNGFFVFPYAPIDTLFQFRAKTKVLPQTLFALACPLAGLGKLAAHDLRSTLITIGLDSGGHVKDLQDQAGHANAATTLRYAQASDPRKRREKIKLPFA